MNLEEIEQLIIGIGVTRDRLNGEGFDGYELSKKKRIKRALEELQDLIEWVEHKAAPMRAERDARKAELIKLGVENMKARG